MVGEGAIMLRPVSATGDKSYSQKSAEQLLLLLDEFISECGGHSEAARRLGVSRSYLYEFKAGNRGAGPKLVQGLAKWKPDAVQFALGVEPSDPTDSRRVEPPWAESARAAGHDPDDPDVREVYATAFAGALGAASQFAQQELARRKAAAKGKAVTDSREAEDGEF